MASCSLSLWSVMYTFHDFQTQLGAKHAAFHFLCLLELRIFWTDQRCLNHHFWSTAAWQGFWWELFQECGKLVVLWALSFSSELVQAVNYLSNILQDPSSEEQGKSLFSYCQVRNKHGTKKCPLAWPAVVQWLNWNVDSPSNEIPLVLGMVFPLLPSLNRIGWTLPPFPQ